MTIWRALGLVLIFAATGAAAEAAPRPINYVATPVIASGHMQALQLDMEFQAGSANQTVLELPDEWAAAKQLWRHIDGLTVTGARLVTDSGSKRVLAHAPRARIHVRYKLTLSATDPDVHHPVGEPTVRPDWFLAYGHAVFAKPQGAERTPARFRWGSRPDGWTLASDLEHGRGRVLDLDKLTESVLVGAREAVEIKRPLQGANLRVVVLDKWPFEPAAFVDSVARVMAADNAVWRDAGREFLIAITPLRTSGGVVSAHGSGFGDAFSIEGSTNADLTKNLHLLAHEYMHTWIPLEVGGFPAKDEARDYWLSEGFTDFYAARALLRAGLWSLEDMAGRYSEVLLRYAGSPARNLTADEVLAKFWTDRDAQQSPYDRGLLLAVIWDREVRRASSGRASLDDVVRRQRQMARDEAGQTAATLFPRAFKATTPNLDPTGAIERHVLRGETVVLPSDTFDGCLVVETVTVPAFDFGFDPDASAKTGVISGVDPAGRAYAAGLRDGMKRIRREGGKNGDSRVEIGYRVADAAGVERVIRWRPEGRTTTTFQEISVAADLTSPRRAACTRLLSGS